jgi:hypothetical protein
MSKQKKTPPAPGIKPIVDTNKTNSTKETKMKTLVRLLTIGLLATWLAGCAPPGRDYDDSKLAMITKDVTTETELLKWFGPATTRDMSQDGTKELTWILSSNFGSSGFGSPGKLNVFLSADGKVISYTATADTRR